MSALDVERMSRVDTAWLRMDNDVNLMMIVGVWMLTPAITLAALRERVADKLLKYPRFHQKAVPDALGAAWVEDDHFELTHHVLPAPPLARRRGESERHALQRLCGALATTPLDPARPLWQFHFVDRYEGGSALIARVHHCIGDGISLISVMLSLTDGGSDPPQRRRRAEAAVDEPEADWLTRAVLGPMTALTTRAIDLTGEGVAKSIGRLADPAPLQGSLALARVGAQVMADLAALALMADDAPTRLKGKPVGRKVVAWSEPLPLDEVKAVGRGLGCSVNDVLLSCAAGAIGGWLVSQGDDPTGQEIRAMVPVNLRPPGDAWKLGNRFGLAPLVLPIGLPNPVERVYAVRARMNALKGSFQPLLAFGVLALSGLFIKPVQDAVLGLFSKKATAVMTNVPGPATPLTLCGATLRQTLFWVPSSGNIGVGVSILSYGGGVQFGLITDEALCPDPQQIIDRFAPEFEAVMWLALMLPWGEGAA
ncbi:MAG: wax ester/triacylglycerol synthase family O-acyltransferase [Rubrivivax sp.]